LVRQRFDPIHRPGLQRPPVWNKLWYNNLKTQWSCKETEYLGILYDIKRSKKTQRRHSLPMEI